MTNSEKQEPLVMSNEMSKVASKEKTNGAMKKLLSDKFTSFDDKIATVKTAQVVDKGRFESAFKTLMKG